MQTIICMKWGTLYGVEYVNRLYNMAKRNTDRPLRFVCFTDDPAGMDSGVEALPLPSMELPERARWDGWRKLSVWQPELSGITGDVLYLDIDLVLTGSIDAFFDFEPERSFCVIENWTQVGQKIGNTSVFRFRVGAHPYIFHRFEDDPEPYLGKYRIEQIYISREISEMVFWPTEWCASFKHTLLPRWPLNFIKAPPLPADTRVVAFTGRPNPDESRDGIWPAAWYKKTYKHVRPTPWIAEHWR
jgi:hypothetical protein